MYSSDLLRAKHTAEIVGRHLKLEPELRQELRERNLGRCVGESVQWLKENKEPIIIVSHGDLLSVFNMMWIGLDVEIINKCELFGGAGGVTFISENEDGKRFIRRMSDMSYIK